MRISEVTTKFNGKIFIDMDGVLADFFSEWARLDGKNHYKDIDNAEEKLQLVRDHPTFWIDLPMLPNAKNLIKTAVELFGEYYICSKPLEGDPRSKPGKLRWIENHLSDMPPKDIILTADKAKYAVGKNGIANLLIDDYGKYINSWREAGGIGIKYEDEKFQFVKEMLRDFSEM